MPPIRFFLPGPTFVHPEVLAAQAAQPVAHRSAAFREIYERVAQRLAVVFRSEREVILATGSGTLLMQAAVQSLVERRVLHLVCGAFSARWQEISRSLGKEADTVAVPWGEAVAPELVRQALRRARYDAVTLAHCETSTGVLSPLPEIAAVVREESEALLLVDAVSSLAGAAVETAEWGLDLVLTASQKALALPPGLAFATLSPRAEERAERGTRRGFYTDLRRYLQKHREGGPISTPAVTLVYALDRQLERLLAEGVEERWERHRRLLRRTEAWSQQRGVPFAAAAGARSPTVSALRAPAGWQAPAWVQALARRGFTVGGGYGDWKRDTFRIGHMGEVSEADLDGLLAALDDVLAAGR
ncbi:MAG TPA: alanine--glyoxylate aminotransferase family protein [Thermoanaerobaculia bacterium]|nr:alanine--glyoxylate aminotransferase family protein [Thermoanaerobaculia bacterium]